MTKNSLWKIAGALLLIGMMAWFFIGRLDTSVSQARHGTEPAAVRIPERDPLDNLHEANGAPGHYGSESVPGSQ